MFFPALARALPGAVAVDVAGPPGTPFWMILIGATTGYVVSGWTPFAVERMYDNAIVGFGTGYFAARWALGIQKAGAVGAGCFGLVLMVMVGEQMYGTLPATFRGLLGHQNSHGDSAGWWNGARLTKHARFHAGQGMPGPLRE